VGPSYCGIVCPVDHVSTASHRHFLKLLFRRSSNKSRYSPLTELAIAWAVIETKRRDSCHGPKRSTRRTTSRVSSPGFRCLLQYRCKEQAFQEQENGGKSLMATSATQTRCGTGRRRSRDHSSNFVRETNFLLTFLSA
jgi:hypothetical protein